MVALVWVGLAMAATLGLLYLFQRSLTYLPSQHVPPPPAGVEEVSYETEDGVTLSAWFVRSNANRGSVIVFNGNAGNRAGRLPLGQTMAAAGYSVLLTDYRGYGGNGGSSSEQGLAIDARAALHYMTERVGSERIIYFGESLGAGVALELAIEHPPAALVLRSPFTSLPDVASIHYPYLPTSLLLIDRYPNLERIGDIDAPLLVIGGSEDTIVPISQTTELYEAAREPKELVVIDGVGHNDPVLLDGDEMMDAITRFLSDGLGG